MSPHQHDQRRRRYVTPPVVPSRRLTRFKTRRACLFWQPQGVRLEKLPADAGMALKPAICSYGPDFPGANKQIEEISVTKRHEGRLAPCLLPLQVQ
ncbi:hypothetical protein JL39_21940 [Rhizobium sp. YS-1r]|nr:hypothetical protein JL39_21940 [Rhizobium sp. YS-1r]